MSVAVPTDILGVGLAIFGIGAPASVAILKLLPSRSHRDECDDRYVSREVFDATISPLRDAITVLGKKLDLLIEMHMKKG